MLIVGFPDLGQIARRKAGRFGDRILIMRLGMSLLQPPQTERDEDYGK